ncbi:NAD(P)/FAD-dependent oxidoreductase, partial [Escherichia coli]
MDNSRKMLKSDIAVIGAGIQGLSCALQLSRAGRRVIVVDRGSPFREASGVNAGSISVQILDPSMWPYAAESIRLWDDLSNEFGRGFRIKKLGGLRVASSVQEAEALKASIEPLRSAGLSVD